METLIRDVAYSVKLLKKDRTFSATVLLTLALCIGANVAIFSVIHSVLLQPLPFQDADRLVTVFQSYPGAGVEPSLGRGFAESETDVGNDRKVVLTHGYWQEHFGGAVDVLGRDLRVDGRPFTIVGVLPESFEMVGREETRFFMPIPFEDYQRTLEAWHNNGYEMMARLRPGATVEQAMAQNEALNQALIDEWPLPEGRQLLEDVGYATYVLNAQDDMVRNVRSTLYMLWAGVTFVLLIGCVNIANLMLARSQVRLGEMATRLALGAKRITVARQVLTEAVVLGVVGGVTGVGIGALGLRLFSTVGVDQLPRGAEISLNGTVLFFALTLAVGAGILFGAIPVVHVMRSELSSVFRAAGRTGTANRRAVLLRSALVTSQVGLAFVMLIGAGLMFMSFRAALAVDPGFRPNGMFTAAISLPEARYPDDPSRSRFIDEWLGRVRALPGVQAVSVTSQLPFSGSRSSSIIFPEDRPTQPGESILSPFQTRIGPGYFEALGTALVEGRDFRESDGPDAPNVIIIDEWLARRYWPESSPLGKRMVWSVAPGADSIPEESLFTVIGVVESIKQNDLTASESEQVGAYYFTYRQDPFPYVTLVARTAAEPTGITSAVRETLGRIDAELPLYAVETMEDKLSDSLMSRRTPLTLLWSSQASHCSSPSSASTAHSRTRSRNARERSAYG
jgi:predicted permease